MRNFDKNQSLVLKAASRLEAEEPVHPVPNPMPRPAPRRSPSYFPALALTFAAVASAFWIGVWGAYLLGYFGPQRLAALDLQQQALFIGGIALPPFLFIALAAALGRAHKLAKTAEALQAATDQLFNVDDTAARSAATLGRAVRRELDALNAGLEGAFGRLRTLEHSLENQVAALDEAGARAEVRGEAIAARMTQESQRLVSALDEAGAHAEVRGEEIAARLIQQSQRMAAALDDASARAEGHGEAIAARMTQESQKLTGALDAAGARVEARGQAVATRMAQESQRLESLGDNLTDVTSRAAEAVAGRAAQLRASIETAEGALKMASQALDVQAAGFRAAAQAVADAPHQAAVDLDTQSKKIEEVSEAALARAEFVLARQEKHRQQMNDLLGKLKEDSAVFDTALTQQSAGMEQAIRALDGGIKRFELMTSDAGRQLDTIMANAAGRANHLTASFSHEAEQLKQISDVANVVLTGLITTLRDAGQGAQTLIGESAAQAKHDARTMVGEAMAECDKLLRAAGQMAAEAGQMRSSLMQVIDDVEKHISRLPIVAQGEAQRVRQMVQTETDQILDLSARTISTIHARGARPSAAPAPQPETSSEGEGLKGLARKLTQRPKRDMRDTSATSGTNKGWEMKTLLAAVETGSPPQLQPGSAAALGALEVALADMAVDLEAIAVNATPGEEDWKRYLSGDRALFARKLAAAIDDNTVDRIAALYREDSRFHEAADHYLTEFEGLLAKAKEGDGGGLLTSTILSADTGKIYLAIAYALGRL